PDTSVLAKVIAESINAGSAVPLQEALVRSANGIEVLRRRFASTNLPGRGRFLQQLQMYFSDFAQLETADFLIVKVVESAASSPAVDVDIRYEFVGTRKGIGLEQRIGLWRTEWRNEAIKGWQVLKWEFVEETISRVREPLVIDISAQARGQSESYQTQMLRGTDEWRTALDGA